jgi:ribose transport system substrate-binding protein
MKKFSFLAIIVLLTSMILAACNSSDEKTSGDNANGGDNEGKPKVTVVLKTLSSQYWKFVEAGAKQAFEDFGVDGTVLGPSSEDKVIEQVNMMEDTLSQGPDAFVVAPTQPPTAVPVLEKFKEQGIPVLLVDTDVDWDDKTTYIGTENYIAGQKAGELLASMLNKGDKVALIAGALGNPATDNRIKGAKEYLEENGFEIVAEQPADSDRAKGMSVMENILQTNPDVKGVFAANDEMALGALKAVQDAGLDIKVIGTDGTVEAVESIIAGGLAGTVAQMPYDMGYLGVENAVKAIKGEVVEKRIDSGVDIITAENAEEKLSKLKEMLD